MSTTHEYYLNAIPRDEPVLPLSVELSGFSLSPLDYIATTNACFEALADTIISCRAIIDPPSEHMQEVLGCGPNDRVVSIDFWMPPEGFNFAGATKGLFAALMLDYRQALDDWQPGDSEPSDTLLKRLLPPGTDSTDISTTTHFFYFPTERAAMRAAQVLLDIYRYRDVCAPSHWGDEPNPWLVTLRTEMMAPVSMDLIDEFTCLAQRHGGIYDFYE
jgi:hypothetical protein